MYLSKWIIALIVVVIVCLIVRMEKLVHHVRKQRKIIDELEGEENNASEDKEQEELGDVEGRG